MQVPDVHSEFEGEFAVERKCRLTCRIWGLRLTTALANLLKAVGVLANLQFWRVTNGGVYYSNLTVC
jgi:hypothetical protein